MEDKSLTYTPQHTQDTVSALPSLPKELGTIAESSCWSFVKKHQLIIFFILAYVITWGGWAALLATKTISSCSTMCILYPGWGPTLAALILTTLIGGRKGLKEFFLSLVKFRVGFQWYLLALFSAVVVVHLSIAFVTLVFGGFTDTAFLPYWYTPFLAFFPAIAVHFLFSGLPEEPGWRGFALPRLLTRHNALVASLILGIFEALWHLPNYTILSPFSPMLLAIFTLNILAVGIFRTWIFVNTKRSVFIATLFHGAIDATGSIFLLGVGKNFAIVFITITIIFCILAIGLLAIYGPNLTRSKQKGEVI